jgi:hypothetical protein
MFDDYTFNFIYRTYANTRTSRAERELRKEMALQGNELCPFVGRQAGVRMSAHLCETFIRYALSLSFDLFIASASA